MVLRSLVSIHHSSSQTLKPQICQSSRIIEWIAAYPMSTAHSRPSQIHHRLLRGHTYIPSEYDFHNHWPARRMLKSIQRRTDLSTDSLILPRDVILLPSEGTSRCVRGTSLKLSCTHLAAQRSLVILSQHPYPSLFYTILSYLGQSFLIHGAPMLEVACHNIANW